LQAEGNAGAEQTQSERDGGSRVGLGVRSGARGLKLGLANIRFV
jgi:hypothetical protein